MSRCLTSGEFRAIRQVSERIVSETSHTWRRDGRSRKSRSDECSEDSLESNGAARRYSREDLERCCVSDSDLRGRKEKVSGVDFCLRKGAWKDYLCVKFDWGLRLVMFLEAKRQIGCRIVWKVMGVCGLERKVGGGWWCEEGACGGLGRARGDIGRGLGGGVRHGFDARRVNGRYDLRSRPMIKFVAQSGRGGLQEGGKKGKMKTSARSVDQPPFGMLCINPLCVLEILYLASLIEVIWDKPHFLLSRELPGVVEW
ncbi:hypothetical protein Tco_1400122 [Tanacetum coccineum]